MSAAYYKHVPTDLAVGDWITAWAESLMACLLPDSKQEK